MAVIVGFHSYFVNCELARRGVRRIAAVASGSGGVQHAWVWYAVGLTSIFDR